MSSFCRPQPNVLMSVLVRFIQACFAVRDHSPVLRKPFVHLLLAFCIGFVPVLDAVAATASHAFAMSMDCTDCEPSAVLPGDSCAHDECPSTLGVCGLQAGVALPGEYFAVRTDALAQESPFSRNGPRKRPDIDDSLYRPPIG